jgi:hypothetical protein
VVWQPATPVMSQVWCNQAKFKRKAASIATLAQWRKSGVCQALLSRA